MKNIFALALILALAAPSAHAAFIAGNKIDPAQLTGNADSRIKRKPEPVMQDIAQGMPNDVLLAAVPTSSIETPDTSSDNSIFIFNVVETGYDPYAAQYVNSVYGNPAAYRGAPYQNFRGYGNTSGYTNTYGGYNNTGGYRSGYSF
jgi:hypothetical protein